MRFLRQTSPAQLRLGWLRVIASLVGAGRLALDDLRSRLEKTIDASEHWLADAGYTETPRGNVTVVETSRIARMGLNYGVYSEETTALTDVGHVLRTVAPWSLHPAENPLRWNAPGRWIGFWIVMSAAGDVFLPLFRSWSVAEQTTAEAAERLGSVLMTLARHAPPDERGLLRRQAEASSPKREKFRAHASLYPYIEPLRDLGYVTRTSLVGGGSAYRLTEAGIRLREAFRNFDGDTEMLLNSGISRAFLRGEGQEGLLPAPGSVLASTLAAMPPELTVLRPEEVPLVPAVLLAQARLLKDGKAMWLDPRRAHDMLKAVGQRGAKVEVKRGSSSRELNIAWEAPTLLTDQALWDVEVELHEPFTRAFVAEAENSDEAPALLEASSRTAAVGDLPDEAATGYGDLSAHVHDGAGPAVDAAEARHGHDDSNPNVMLTGDVPAPLRLWLQYVDCILSPRRKGALDSARWGGLSTGFGRLRALLRDLPNRQLDEKRSLCRDMVIHPRAQQPARKPLCLRPILRLERLLQDVGEEWIAHRIHELWLDGSRRGDTDLVHLQDRDVVRNSTKDTRRDPHPAVDRGIRHLPHIVGRLENDVIRPFLDMSPDDQAFWQRWDLAREATRSIVHDNISEGAWSAASLRAQLHDCLSRGGPQAGSRQWLALLSTAPAQARYTQRRRFPHDVWEALGFHDQSKSQGYPLEIRADQHVREDGTFGVEFVVALLARSDFEARNLGRRRVHSFLAERYAQRAVQDADGMVDLHERPDDEHVEFFDRMSGPAVLEDSPRTKREMAGLSFASSARDVATETPGPSIADAGSYGEMSAARQRLSRARRGIVGARRPGLHADQRVMLAWMAMEQLVTGGREGKGETVIVLAAAASLIHLRAELSRILSDARAGLWLTASMQPTNATVGRLVACWLNDLPDGLRAEIGPETSEGMRKARAMTPMPHIDELDGLRLLWQQLGQVEELRDHLRPWAPLASVGLHDFFVLMVGAGKSEGKPAIGDGAKLSLHFRELYEDTSSFFAQVYEMRNRVAHGGGMPDQDHDPAADEVYLRFVALAEPVLNAAEYWTDKGVSLDEVWALALDKAQDLADLGESRDLTTDDLAGHKPAEPLDGSGSTGATTARRPAVPKGTRSKPRQALKLERLIELLTF